MDEYEEKLQKVDSVAAEFQKQFDDLEMSVVNLTLDNESSSTKLKSVEEKHGKTVEDFQAKERQFNVEERSLKGKLRLMESQSLRTKLEYEERFKSMCQELKMYSAQGKIFQQEAETAKDQLKFKVVEIIKLEKKISDLTTEKNTKLEQSCGNNDKKKKDELNDAKAELVQLKQHFSQSQEFTSRIVQTNSKLHETVLNLENEKEHFKEQVLQLKKEMLHLQCNRPAQSESSQDFPTEKDLVIAQLEQEVEDLKKELREVNEDKDSLQRQLNLMSR